jgi:hypothetical protein
LRFDLSGQIDGTGDSAGKATAGQEKQKTELK